MQLEDGIDRTEWKVGDIETPVSTSLLYGHPEVDRPSLSHTSLTGTLCHHRLKAYEHFSQAVFFMLVDYCKYFIQ